MKPIILIIFIAITFSAGFIIIKDREQAGAGDQRAQLVMREIGHRILLHSGDSNSRVLPVKRISASVYQLEFESNFKFIPDTLVKVIHSNLTKAGLPLTYSVNVFDCKTLSIIYGYQIGDQTNTTVPCLGRDQVEDCYSIQITFQQTVSSNAAIGYAGLGIGLLLAGFMFIRRERKPLNIDPSFVPLGSYSFSFEKRVIHTGNSAIALTDKESKILNVLATNRNQPIDRDHLMKEVWEDEGVIVGRSLDVFVSRLRKKFPPASRIKLVSIHGKGYKLEVE
jgi:hypothetical protein